jgi:hypothetical protein
MRGFGSGAAAPGTVETGANVMPDLAYRMKMNPKMKVMLAGYDYLVTPYFECVYEMHHLHMPATCNPTSAITTRPVTGSTSKTTTSSSSKPTQPTSSNPPKAANKQFQSAKRKGRVLSVCSQIDS